MAKLKSYTQITTKKYLHRLDLSILFIVCVLWQPLTASPTPNTFNILEVVKDVTVKILKTWLTIDEVTFDGDIGLSTLLDKQRNVLNHLESISKKIETAEKINALHVAVTIETLSEVIIQNTELAKKVDVVRDMNKLIKLRYSEMEQYREHRDTIEPSTLLAFANWNVKPNPSSIQFLMEQLHSTLFDDGDVTDSIDSDATLFSQLVSNYDTNTDQICEFRLSPQQFAYNLYAKTVLTELKGYTMMEFSWMLLRELGKGNFTQELNLMRSNYKLRTESANQHFRNIITHTGRTVWRCDPKKHVPGETYDAVTRLLQGYIENEVNLEADGTCWSKCSDFQNSPQRGCYGNEFCKVQPRCNGRLYDCQFLKQDYTVCLAGVNSTNRYDYIASEDQILGAGDRIDDTSKPSCDRGTHEVESWRRYLFWNCHYCLCLCDEEGPLSDRYFNMRKTVTDFKQNMVATGVRFIKVNRVFHLQLQQGQLQPHGAINHSTLAWVPVDAYSISDVDLRNGYDYFTLSYNSRSFDLDDITTNMSGSYVVTGVRFRAVGAHLNLEVRFSQFDVASGLLVNPIINSFWQSNDNTVVFGSEWRKKLILNDADLSTRSPLKSVPRSTHNQYLDFISSSLTKDAAQNTLPYIDIQSVVPNTPVALSGIGTYYKGHPGFGGFFAPKITTYDLSNNL